MLLLLLLLQFVNYGWFSLISSKIKSKSRSKKVIRASRLKCCESGRHPCVAPAPNGFDCNPFLLLNSRLRTCSVLRHGRPSRGNMSLTLRRRRYSPASLVCAPKGRNMSTDTNRRQDGWHPVAGSCFCAGRAMCARCRRASGSTGAGPRRRSSHRHIEEGEGRRDSRE